MSTEDNNVTWREMLLDKMQGTGESWGDILGIDVKGEDDKRLTNEYPFCEDNEAVRLCDLAVDQLLDLKFYKTYYTTNIAITVWTTDFVYFSRQYDEMDYVDKAREEYNAHNRTK